MSRASGALAALAAVAGGLLTGALIGLVIVQGGTGAAPRGKVLAIRHEKALPASARLSHVRISMLNAAGREDIAILTVGQPARLRLHWTLSHFVGHPRETVIWRVMRRGRLLVDDHATDHAGPGRAYWDDVLTVNRSWAGGARYTVVGSVSVAGQTQSARLTFLVARPRRR